MFVTQKVTKISKYETKVDNFIFVTDMVNP